MRKGLRIGIIVIGMLDGADRTGNAAENAHQDGKNRNKENDGDRNNNAGFQELLCLP